MNEKELYHYGILGQKWGIRRYENYDGTYTQAGLKRYRESERILDLRKQKYKDAKKSGVKGYKLDNLKANVKAQKREVNNNYKRLKNDMQADKGKIRYKNGERISSKSAFNRALHTAGNLAIPAAAWGLKMGLIDRDTAVKIAAGGAIAKGAAIAKNIIDEIPNNQLRAYYNHTS